MNDAVHHEPAAGSGGQTAETPRRRGERARGAGVEAPWSKTATPAQEQTPVLPELLAPAGDWECARAAVENGADAIYFGLARFNARIRARNFSEADLPGLMEFLHRRGVKGYVTFNTLVFENEMAEAERSLRAIITAGVDAAIVQDAGICRLIRRLSPDFPIHASTQMTITSAAGVEFARELGCQLVVLARECSIREIEKIPPPSLPLEVFVHGALCVAYSGQCLTSEALGGRSANRGECAQACRMPYELIADGQAVPLGDRRYLLSPQDLAGLELLPDLLRAGVASLKIEGRLKTAEYVANITRIYRQALDQCEMRNAACGMEKAKLGTATPPEAASHIPHSEFRVPHYEMEMAFSRGLYTGWLRGVNNQALVHGRFGKKRGVFLGEVLRIRDDKVELRLQGPLKPGDGVVFDAGNPEQEEEGGRVYEIRNLPSDGRGIATVELGFGRGDIDFRRVRAGDRVWKTSDPELDRRLRQTFSGERPRFQRSIDFEVRGGVGEPMTIVARDDSGHVVEAASGMALARAERRPLDDERLREQLGRLGGTPFRLGRLDNRLDGGVLLPVSELNRLRRDLVRQLEARRAQPHRWTLTDCRLQIADCRLAPTAAPGVPLSNLQSKICNLQLVVLVRNLAQLETALQAGIETVYCEFEDPKKYRDAVQRFRQARTPSDARPGQPKSAICNLQSEIFVAPPRIFKPGEDWILKQVRSCDADGYLVRNYDHLSFFADTRRVGDFSLNVANALTAEHFIGRFGLERVTASYDLNFAQLEALLRAAPPAWFEITIHQHMPMFHMEHCVFCAFLSSGTDYTNCGRPCDRHDLKLRDRVGAEHPVKADLGCRNTVFNGVAQTGAEYVARMLALGARRFRIEFLNEPPGQVAQTIARYRQLLDGLITGGQLWRELKLVHQLGVTRGQMEN